MARTERRRIEVRGRVQGVGFRPFVFRTASQLGLSGWVRNDGGHVTIEVEGEAEIGACLAITLRKTPPPNCVIEHIDETVIGCVGGDRFAIIPSSMGNGILPNLLPDIATCPSCARELWNPLDRRFRYPFITCTACGPRYTVIESLPYDRERTSMRHFEMCPACYAEYSDPTDRRFHSQTNACSKCGPQLVLRERNGGETARGDRALREAALAVAGGAIIALQGLGGYQLICDAGNDLAVDTLRKRKQRPGKPFAVMCPDLDWVHRCCVVGASESGWLRRPEAPILLLREQPNVREFVSEGVAPGLVEQGVMLPNTPLHLLLLDELRRPVVATSGNRSGEPICISAEEAHCQLGEYVDLFLEHSRPIVRHADDSVARVVGDQVQTIRIARGLAPLSIDIPWPVGCDTLAAGSHLKAASAIARGHRVVLCPHIGDLDSAAALATYRSTTNALIALHGLAPKHVIRDLHPDYATTIEAERWGRQFDTQEKPVQHHYAHVMAVLAEHGLNAPVLGVAWDGTGFGSDETIWGGEFLLVDRRGWRRVASLWPFKLPGGDRAVMEPRRTALALVHEAGLSFEEIPERLARRFDTPTLEDLWGLLEAERAGPVTTSAGRLFDGVAALLGITPVVSYEAEAAMRLEHLQRGQTNSEAGAFPLIWAEDGVSRLDWRPFVRDIVDGEESAPVAGRMFHVALANTILATAQHVGLNNVVLAGGCFVNRTLLELTEQRLTKAGFECHRPSLIPPGDGGLAVGQIVAAGRD